MSTALRRLVSPIVRKRRRVGRGPWYAEQWANAATATGWDASELPGGFLELRRNGERRLVHGTEAGLDTAVAYRLAGSKIATSQLLSGAGLTTPAETACSARHVKRIVDAVRSRPGRLVVKPAAGTGGGSGITVGPASGRSAVRAVRDAAAWGPRLILQDAVEGEALRALVVDGDLVDVVSRSPASVVGDGRSSVAELVGAENARRETLGPLATGFIPTGEDFRVALGRAGFTAGSTPSAGRSVVVSGCSNTGSELESRRVEVDESVAQVARTASELVGLRVAGVDLIVDPETGAPTVLEVNGAPGLHWHVLVDGEPFDPFVRLLT